MTWIANTLVLAYGALMLMVFAGMSVALVRRRLEVRRSTVLITLASGGMAAVCVLLVFVRDL